MIHRVLGVFIAISFGFILAHGFRTGVMPMAAPMRRVTSIRHPLWYWLTTAAYVALFLFGLALALDVMGAG